MTRPSASGPPLHRDFLLEVAPLDVLHHQVMAVLIVEAVGYGRNRGMLQLGEGVGLAGEIFVRFQPLLRIDEVIDHLLDSAGPARQALVARQVDHPHPAAAQQALDQVAILQDGAAGQGSRDGGVGVGLVRRLAGHLKFVPGNSFRETRSRKLLGYSTKITTAEMLSVPPPALAATISSRATASGSL